MNTIHIDEQKDFEYRVCEVFKVNSSNAIIMQRNDTEQMIINDWAGLEDLTGTVAYLRKTKSFLLVATKDSEVNHIESITLKMIEKMIDSYVSFKNGERAVKNFSNKVTFCTNIPIEIHSNQLKNLKENYNFHVENIGYSFCQKHNLEFTQMY